MKRFFNEDDNFFNDEDHEELEGIEYEIDEEAFAEFLSKHALIDTVESQMSESALNQELLIIAMELAQTKPFWRFRTTKNQIAVIKSIYITLIQFRDYIPEDEME